MFKKSYACGSTDTNSPEQQFVQPPPFYQSSGESHMGSFQNTGPILVALKVPSQTLNPVYTIM